MSRAGQRWAMGLAMLVTAAPSPTWAQSPQANATRRALIEQATAARAAGNHTQAIELAQRAAEIRMTASLRMFLAEEQMALGQLAAALDNAETCERDVRAEANVTDRATVASRCEQMAQALNRRVAHVVVRVPRGEPTPTVHVGSDTVPHALWGIPYIVDPGTVVVDAIAAGAAPFHRELHLAEGETQTIDVTLGPATGSHATATGPTPTAAPPTTVVAPTPHPTSNTSVQHPVGSYVVMGLGVAGLGASLAFWLIRTDALQGCTWDSNHGSCDTAQHAMAAQSTGRTFNVAAPIALGVGGALLVAGGVWWVAGAHRERSGVTAWIAPSREGAWAGIEGRF